MFTFRKFLVYLFILLSRCGFRDFILRFIAFQPPRQPTYTFRIKQQIRKSTNERLKTISSNQENKNRIHRISSFITQKDIRPYKTSFIGENEQVTYYDNRKQSMDEALRNSSVNKELYPEHELRLISPEGVLFEMNKLDDLELQCYYIKTKKQNIIPVIFISPIESEFVIIYSHPNAADLGLMLDNYLDLAYNLNINVVGYDYTGYGQSTGKPSDFNAIADLQAVYDFTIRELNFSWDKIILYGQSIGSGPSVTLAADQKYPIAGLIIHSGLSSGLRIIDPTITKTHFYDIFPNIDLLSYVNCLVQILHGNQDNQIDVSSAQQSAEQVKNLYNVWLVEEGGHNNIEFEQKFRSEYFRKLKKFYQEIQKRFKFYTKAELNKFNIASKWRQWDHIYKEELQSYSDLSLWKTMQSQSSNMGRQVTMKNGSESSLTDIELSVVCQQHQHLRHQSEQINDLSGIGQSSHIRQSMMVKLDIIVEEHNKDR